MRLLNDLHRKGIKVVIGITVCALWASTANGAGPCTCCAANNWADPHPGLPVSKTLTCTTSYNDKESCAVVASRDEDGCGWNKRTVTTSGNTSRAETDGLAICTGWYPDATTACAQGALSDYDASALNPCSKADSTWVPGPALPSPSFTCSVGTNAYASCSVKPDRQIHISTNRYGNMKTCAAPSYLTVDYCRTCIKSMKE